MSIINFNLCHRDNKVYTTIFTSYYKQDIIYTTTFLSCHAINVVLFKNSKS